VGSPLTSRSCRLTPPTRRSARQTPSSRRSHRGVRAARERPANAALSAFARLNGRLFDAGGGDLLDQLDARTAAAQRALADTAETVTEERYLFGTITMCAGYGCAGDRCG